MARPEWGHLKPFAYLGGSRKLSDEALWDNEKALIVETGSVHKHINDGPDKDVAVSILGQISSFRSGTCRSAR